MECWKCIKFFTFHSEFSFVGQRLFRYLLDVKLSDELFFIAETNIVIKERKTTSALELSSSCCYWLIKSNPNKNIAAIMSYSNKGAPYICSCWQAVK